MDERDRVMKILSQHWVGVEPAGRCLNPTEIKAIERELAKASQLREYIEEVVDFMLEDLMEEIEESSRNLKRRLREGRENRIHPEVTEYKKMNQVGAHGLNH
jgi:hypothetical protein